MAKVDDISKAREILESTRIDALEQLRLNRGEHKFQMDSAYSDKNGDMTQVLIIDTEAKGSMGLYFNHGNPVTMNTATGAFITDDVKLVAFMQVLANVDLSKDDALVACGRTAIGGARMALTNFFSIQAVAEFTLPAVTEKPAAI